MPGSGRVGEGQHTAAGLPVVQEQSVPAFFERMIPLKDCGNKERSAEPVLQLLLFGYERMLPK
jgi:hypothetical protein